MFARHIVPAVFLLALSVPAFAAENLETFRDVQRQVLRYPHFTIFDSVSADVDDGMVTLTGKVTMPFKKDDIESRVRRLAGVREVHNRIQVLPANVSDDRLRVGIARAIYGHPLFASYATMINPPIHVVVERGRVTLEGVVLSEVERALARSIAGSFLTFELKNELKTEAEAKAELERL
jgi:hyperosmotically inducible periplasmic protein